MSHKRLFTPSHPTDCYGANSVIVTSDRNVRFGPDNGHVDFPLTLNLAGYGVSSNSTRQSAFQTRFGRTPLAVPKGRVSNATLPHFKCDRANMQKILDIFPDQLDHGQVIAPLEAANHRRPVWPFLPDAWPGGPPVTRH